MTTHTTFKEIAVLMLLAAVSAFFSYTPKSDASLSTPVPVTNAVDTQLSLQAIALPTETATVSNLVVRYTTLPKPRENGLESHRQLIQLVSKYANVDAATLAATMGIESQYTSDARNRRGSAQGLCQFTSRTWRTTAKQYGAKYGIKPSTSRLDPRANMLLCAEYIKTNDAYLARVLKREPRPTEIYLAHFLGPAVAVAIIRAKPGAKASHISPSAAGSNPNLFYNKMGKAYTVADFKRAMRLKVLREQSNFAAVLEAPPNLT